LFDFLDTRLDAKSAMEETAGFRDGVLRIDLTRSSELAAHEMTEERT
jgi:hypothetical protein